MPIPTANTVWPPADMEPILASLSEWDAWFSGEPDKLNRVYRSAHMASPQARVRSAQLAGGVVGAMSRWFWGKPNTDLTVTRRPRHVPIAADLCQTSADLLFADPPAMKSVHGPTQVWLDTNRDAIVAALVDAMEVGAALSGTFLRVTWDASEFPTGAFLTSVDADNAVPVFSWGRLKEVTFWWEIERKDQVVWRHLEHHSVENGIGVIEHALFEGTPTHLGRRMALADHESTARIGQLVDSSSRVTTGTPGLAVEYVPNVRPQRRWRSHPVGTNFGRSDLDGIEGLMDSLDEVWTEWMDELVRTRSRIIASESVLDDFGPGRGAGFDLDRSVFTPITTLASRDPNRLPVEVVSFTMQVDKFQLTVKELLEAILRTSGYSTQTFGLDSGGAAATATEIQSRDRRSLLTRDRKIRACRGPITRIIAKLAAVDQRFFRQQLNPGSIQLEFPEGVQVSEMEQAQTIGLWRAAQAMSIDTAVRAAHPDWKDEDVTDEVARISKEASVSMENPMTTVPSEDELED